jgi:CubicO group peptidase (beta-lactamase class C family)
MRTLKLSPVRVAALLCLLWLGTSPGLPAADLPRATPEELGFSSGKLQQIDRFYADKVQRGEIAGIVTLIARHGRIVHDSAIGYADLEARRKMETGTLFRYYSMTKPIASVALMMLYEQGRVQLTDPLSKYIPEFAQLRVLRDPKGPLDDTVAPLRAPTVEDALRHTTGFTHGLGIDAYDSLYTRAHVLDIDTSLEDMMHKLAQIPLKYQPGTRFEYSIGPDIAARLVEIISGQPFDQ